jgi:hypothetical protein
MAILKSMIAVLGLVSLAAISCPRSTEFNDDKQTELAPMPRELQAATRAQCTLLVGPEYHECLYAVIMRRPTW